MADARSLTWLGVPSGDTAAAVRFFTEHLGLVPEVHEGDFAVLRLPSGQTVEFFGPSLREQPQFAAGPVAGFEVADVAATREAMEAAGVEFIGPVHDGDPGRRWSHFRGPDGFVYELTQLP